MEDSYDIVQGDYRCKGISKMADITMVSSILMAGLRPASYKTKKSYRRFTRAREGATAARQKAEKNRSSHRNLSLEKKTGAYNWLYLIPRVAAKAMDAFERDPTIIAQIQKNIMKELNLAKEKDEKPTKFVDKTSRTKLQTFWTENV